MLWLGTNRVEVTARLTLVPLPPGCGSAAQRPQASQAQARGTGTAHHTPVTPSRTPAPAPAANEAPLGMVPLAHPTHHPHLRPASRPPPPGRSPAARAARPRSLHRRSSHALTLTRAQPPRAEAGETDTSSAAATSSSSSVLSFLCPLLKFFGVTNYCIFCPL